MGNGNSILPFAALGAAAFFLLRKKPGPVADDCPPGMARNPLTGECQVVEPPPPDCPEGEVWDGQMGECVSTGIDVPPTPSGVLTRGSSGPRVKTLQRRLCAFFRSLGPADPFQFGDTEWAAFDDGSFGEVTEQAVAEFQGYVGITADGKAGPQTQGQLSAQLASVGIDPTEVGQRSCLDSFQS